MRDFLNPFTCGEGGCGCGEPIEPAKKDEDCGDDCACHDEESDCDCDCDCESDENSCCC
jgi:hypothetical protein